MIEAINRLLPLASVTDDWIALIIIPSVIVFIVGMIILGYRAQKKRSERLAGIAEGLGMQFTPDSQKSDGFGFSHMPLFSKGRSRRIRNLMSGPMADADGYLFDYRYTTGGGKNSSTYNQTVAVFHVPQHDLPGFSCKPEHFFHKVADMFGYDDINFESYPVFSKNFRLTGTNEAAVRTIFSPQVIELLQKQTDKPWSIDAEGKWIAIYRPSRRIPPEQWSEFLLESTSLLNELTL
ncbi:MAG: hypothetical protein AAGC73_06905 [Verrucomicrobiota bacterium]